MRIKKFNLTDGNNQIEAEKTIIEISNDVYTSLDLKPMSKTVFFYCQNIISNVKVSS